MDIYSYLRKDHRHVSDLFEKIISARLAKSRQKLFEKLKKDLLEHSETENDTFYRALKQYVFSRDLVDHAKEEHDDIKSALRKLEKLAMTNHRWFVQLGELKNSVEHHVDYEEHDMFKIAKEVLTDTQAKQLAKEMDELKHKKTPRKRMLHRRSWESSTISPTDSIARLF